MSALGKPLGLFVHLRVIQGHANNSQHIRQIIVSTHFKYVSSQVQPDCYPSVDVI